MRYARLGETGPVVSVVGLGAGNFGGVGSDPALFGLGDDDAAAFAVMDAARAQGITLFDTANSYGGGRSEATIGRWLRSRRARDQVVLTTKVRNRVGPGPEDEGLSPRHIGQQIEASLRRLGTDHVDLYLAHEPDPATPLEATLEAFDQLVRAGKARHVGLSNFDAEGLRSAARICRAGGLAPVANLQNGRSLLDPGPAGPLDACAELGVGFTAFSPLAGGWLTGKYRPDRPYPAGSRMTLRPEPYARFTRAATGSVLDELEVRARSRSLDMATLALAWVLADPRVTAVLVAPHRPEQLAPALHALEVELTEGDRAELEALGGGVDVAGGAAGAGRAHVAGAAGLEEGSDARR